MGQLTRLEALAADLGLAWYLENVRDHSSDKISSNYMLPDPAFPWECAIDKDTFGYNGNHSLKREIRKWVDDTLSDIVIMDRLDLTYFYRYNRESDGYQVSHGYYRFFFESETSCTMFKLRFSEHIVSHMQRFKTDSVPYNRVDEPNIWIHPHKRGEDESKCLVY